MANEKRNIFLKIAKLMLAAILVFNVIPAKQVTADSYEDGATVEQAGTELADTDYKKYEVTTGKHDGIAIYTGKYYDLTEADATRMIKGEPYTAYFTLNYENIPLTVKATATLLSDVDDRYEKDNEEFAKIFINGIGLLETGWAHVHGAETKWEIRIYDENGVSYLKYFLFGFLDPDESDYSFNIPADGSRKIYYVDAADSDSESSLTAAKYFTVKHGDIDVGGFYRGSGDKLFNDAIFAVNVFDDETTFTFKSISPDQGGLTVPYFYSLKYKITYDLNDADGPSAVIEDGNPDSYVTSPKNVYVTKNPTREGYDFLGWREVYDDGKESAEYSTVVLAESSGDKRFKAEWAPHHYSVEYYPNPLKEDQVVTGSTENQPDRAFGTEYLLSPNGFAIKGHTFKGWTYNDGVQTPVDFKGDEKYKNLTTVDKGVVKLYAQWEPIKYKVKYNANEPEGETATGSMADQTPLSYDVDYNLTENAYKIDGYHFLGWSTVPKENPVEYEDQAGFRNLVEEDGGEVTMYAQWKPWTYTIKYNANGGYGDMPDQVFTSKDASMTSVGNRFARDQYRFKFFTYMYKGVEYIVYNVEDLAAKLIELGPDSSITLYAQWELTPPESNVTVYKIPVTGVE